MVYATTEFPRSRPWFQKRFYYFTFRTHIFVVRFYPIDYNGRYSIEIPRNFEIQYGSHEYRYFLIFLFL